MRATLADLVFKGEEPQGGHSGSLSSKPLTWNKYIFQTCILSSHAIAPSSDPQRQPHVMSLQNSAVM